MRPRSVRASMSTLPPASQGKEKPRPGFVKDSKRSSKPATTGADRMVDIESLSHSRRIRLPWDRNAPPLHQADRYGGRHNRRPSLGLQTSRSGPPLQEALTDRFRRPPSFGSQD